MVGVAPLALVPLGALSAAGSAYTFGVISDVQWADIPDGRNFDGTIPRHYRGAFETLERAVGWWNARFPQRAVVTRHNGAENTADPDQVEDARRANSLFFVAQIGDLIDVHSYGDGVPSVPNRSKPSGGSARAMALSLEQLHHRLRAPVLHNLGNHEIYTHGRDKGGIETLYRNPYRLHHSYRQGNMAGNYHSFSPAPGHRLITLDAYQDAVIGWAPDDPRRVAATRWLTRRNPNLSPDPGARCAIVNCLNGTKGFSKRFVPFSGGLGAAQRTWLDEELKQAVDAHERVVLLSHVVMHPQAGSLSTILWDYDEAEALLARHGCVVAVLCGHHHRGGYHRDEHGIHHLTFISPLMQGARGDAFGALRFYEDRFELLGPRLSELIRSHPPIWGSDHWGSELPPVRRDAPTGLERMRFDFGGVFSPPSPWDAWAREWHDRVAEWARLLPFGSSSQLEACLPALGLTLLQRLLEAFRRWSAGVGGGGRGGPMRRFLAMGGR